MRTANICLEEIFNDIPATKREETRLSFAISNRLDALMKEKGLNRKQLAQAVGKQPNEVTRWLSGEHNFTLATLAMLATFFGKPIISVETFAPKG
ncbi:MAG: helix-turn-helix transcriptional regulator [Bacteroidales bacterium]|nr:helix-turn-helix transcriptional regulator [Bacteroidales bacterium]